MEETRVREEKKRGKEEESNTRETMYCVWNIQAYGLLLQKQERRGTSTGALK